MSESTASAPGGLGAIAIAGAVVLIGFVAAWFVNGSSGAGAGAQGSAQNTLAANQRGSVFVPATNGLRFTRETSVDSYCARNAPGTQAWTLTPRFDSGTESSTMAEAEGCSALRTTASVDPQSRGIWCCPQTNP